MRAVVMLFLLLVATGHAAPALVPLPQVLIQTNAGSFTLCPRQAIPGVPAPAPTKILVDAAARQTGEYLAIELYKSTGYRFQIESDSGFAPVANAILLTRRRPTTAGSGTSGDQRGVGAERNACGTIPQAWA